MRTEHIKATVIDIKIIAKKQKKYSVQLELPDGKIIKLLMVQEPPGVGDDLPIIVDVYEDGQNHYIIDKVAWITK